MVRQRPADSFLAEALANDVGVLARVPLASGLLTGKYDAASTFAENDHRHYNRHGQAFDVGETFAGLDYEAGLAFVAADVLSVERPPRGSRVQPGKHHHVAGHRTQKEHARMVGVHVVQVRNQRNVDVRFHNQRGRQRLFQLPLGGILPLRLGDNDGDLLASHDVASSKECGCGGEAVFVVRSVVCHPTVKKH